MQFSIQLPTDRVDRGDEFLGAEALAQLARAAEEAGFAACFVTDHPAPSDRWLAAGGHHALDPFVALSFAAAATTRIRLQTHILVLPYRNPFLAAKSAASLDALCGGRLILGVAAGYLRDEFAALGADFEHRNELCDEAITVMKRIWTQSGIHLEGRGFRAAGHSARPRPAQQPHPPIWVGGNTPRAIRRAVELGDGWLPFPAPARMARFVRTRPMESAADLERGLAYARAHAQKVGREERLDVCFASQSVGPWAKGKLPAAAVLEDAARLEKLGVGWLAISLPAEDRARWCAQVARFGEQVIAAGP